MKNYKKRPWIGKTRYTIELENIVKNFTHIISAEVIDKHVYFAMAGEPKCRKIRARMKDIATLLTHEILLRTHESFIINMKRVLDFCKRGDGLTAILEEGKEAPVTENMKPIFKAAFKKYTSEAKTNKKN